MPNLSQETNGTMPDPENGSDRDGLPVAMATYRRFDGEVPESTSSPFPVFRTQVSSAIADHPEHRAIPLLDHPHSLIPALTATARPAATGAATGVSMVPSCSAAALGCTARSSGWCSGPTRIGHSCGCWARAPRSPLRDPWVTRMRNLPATVVSTTLEGPLDWPNATVVSGDAVDVVARLKEESEVPLRSHGSLSLNRALMAAGLVDRVQVTLFPVITGQTGADPIFQGAADFDLELIESRTLDGHIQELIYRPTLHV